MSVMEHALFILNPSAGNGRAAVAPDTVKRVLGGRLNFDIVSITPEITAEYLSRNTENYDTVVILGGDGTAHNALKGILARKAEKPPLMLAVMPCGCGNDYCRTTGYSQDLPRALDQLMEGSVRRMDVGMCNRVPFLETISFGLDANIALGVRDLRRKSHLRGRLLYFRSVLHVLQHEYSPMDVMLSIDDQPAHHVDYLLCAAQIGPSYGGGFRITPEADPADGLLDFCCADVVSRPAALYQMMSIANATHVNNEHYHFTRAKHISLDFAKARDAQLDGEPLHAQRFEIECVPSAVDVIVAPGTRF